MNYKSNPPHKSTIKVKCSKMKYIFGLIFYILNVKINLIVIIMIRAIIKT
jgi:hypothetical protein